MRGSGASVSEKGTDTRLQSLEQMIKGDLTHTLRVDSLKIIKSAGIEGMTADEVAAVLGETVLAIRPRITELKNMKAIFDSGNRRRNSSKRWASVMVHITLRQSEYGGTLDLPLEM